MDIYLIRHGKLNWENNKKKCIGITDINLNDEGRKKAEDVGEFLKDKIIKKIFNSDLNRCKESARIISSLLKVPYYSEKKLREIDMGIWENIEFEEIKKLYPIDYEKRGLNIENYRIEQGETFKECYCRSIKIFERIVQDNYEDNIAIITHSGVMKCLICYIENLPLNNILNIKLEYGHILHITYDKKQYKLYRNSLKT